MESKNKADKIVEILNEKKANNVKVIDLRKMSILTDYFVICSGLSTTHIKALADELEKTFAGMGISHSHIEGYESARWVLIDYHDVIVHIFHEQEREFYSLERLWSDGIITGSQDEQEITGQ